MSLSRINPGRSFHSDKDQSERSAREQLKFIINNLAYLKKVRNGSKYVEIARNFYNDKEKFTDKQKSYIDVIYEKVMQGYGLPSFSRTFKR